MRCNHFIVWFVVSYSLLILGGCNSLYQAALENDMQMLQKVISEGADVKNDTLALLSAAENGHIDIVNALLVAGANPNSNMKHISPLIAAVQNGHYDIAKILLEAGADVDKTDSLNQSALFWASSKNDLNTVKLLIEKKADTEIKDKKFEQTALKCAVTKQHVEVAEALLAGGADPNIIEKNGSNALVAAVIQQNAKLVEILLENAADPNITNKFGMSPLMLAAQKTNIEILNNLISHGANIDLKADLGHTALLEAVISGNIVIIKSLVAKGADLNIIETQHGTTPLIQAVMKRNYEIAEYLVRSGANKDIAGYNGGTASQQAINTNDNRLLEILRFNPEVVTFVKVETEFNKEIKTYNERKELYLTAKNDYEKKELKFLNELSNEQLELYSVYTDTFNENKNIAKVLLSFRKFSESLGDVKKDEFVSLYAGKQKNQSDADLLAQMDQNIIDRKKVIADLKKDIAEADQKASNADQQAMNAARHRQNTIAAQQSQNAVGLLSILTTGLNSYNEVQAAKYDAQAATYRQMSDQYSADRRNTELVDSIKGIEKSITKTRRGWY